MSELPEILDTKEDEPIEAYDDYYHLSSASYVIEMLNNLSELEERIDKAMLSGISNARIAGIKRMLIRIAHVHIKEEYESLFPTKTEEDENIPE